MSEIMAGKTGEAALHEKLEQIKLDYTALVEKIKSENVKAAVDLEKKLFKDEEEFKARQERERREFEARMEEEKAEFKEKQVRERDIADSEASQALSPRRARWTTVLEEAAIELERLQGA